MARSSLVRASDADRDAVAERLQQAAVEGRLEPDELEERLHSALRARTYGDLDRLTGDLPRRRPPARPRPTMGLGGMVLAVTVRIVVLLLVVAALLAAFAVSAAWWLIGLLVWLSLRSRRSCAGWHRPPRRVY